MILETNSQGSKVQPSLVWSQGAFDRGLFNGCKFTFYRTELEQKEEFGNPDAATTTDIKSASYEKLKDGIIRVGTHVEKGDAIIGKFVRLSKSDSDKYLYSDRSVVYKDDEPAIVHAVIVDRNEDDERFCKVALRKLRPVVAGDKFSSRSGQLARVDWQQSASVRCSFSMNKRQMRNSSIAGTSRRL
jgi:DNA-directed RNA polymerase beta subunit